MKTLKNLIVPAIIIASLFTFSFNKGDNDKAVEVALKDSSNNYLDGTYNGLSQASYTSEPYWGHLWIKVENSSFTDIRFIIRDSTTHEYVDSMYGVIHYPDIPMFQDQCVNDGHGIETYPKILLETQDLDKVDAITTETWSYHFFMASTKDALKNAKKPNGIDGGSQADKLSVTALPNPFYSTLNLEYKLTEKCYVNLGIYDIEGKLVQQLVDRFQLAGLYTIQWNDCPSAGIYYYRLQAGDKVLCNKLVKLNK